jgi:hypothetical protein
MKPNGTAVTITKNESELSEVATEGRVKTPRLRGLRVDKIAVAVRCSREGRETARRYFSTRRREGAKYSRFCQRPVQSLFLSLVLRRKGEAERHRRKN